MGRENQAAATLVVRGRDLGIWSAMEGGEVDSEETLHYPGAMRPAVSLGGDVATGNVTLQKLLADLSDDEVAHLYDCAGTPDPAVATKQLLDGRNASTRRPRVYRGTVKRVAEPNYDSTSNDRALIEVELTVTGKPTLA